MRYRSLWLGVLMLIGTWTLSALAQETPCSARSACETCNLGEEKVQLLQYEASGQYDHEITEVVDQAKIYLALQRTGGRKLAVVRDVDETALSNWPEMKANDFGFFLNGPCHVAPDGAVQSPCGWKEWVSAGKAMAIAPTLDLYDQARRQGIEVFFITGRTNSQRSSTRDNLLAAGYDGWKPDDLIMEPDNLRPPSVAYFKTAARKKIEARGYIIIMNVGDQDSDLVGGFAERTFKLPNPFYFIP